MRFPAKGDHCHYRANRQFPRPAGQKAKPRQKHRNGVRASQKCRSRIPPPAKGNPCQTGCHQTEQIIHDPVEKKDRIYINDRHPDTPRQDTIIIGQAFRKNRRKTGTASNQKTPIERVRRTAGKRFSGLFAYDLNGSFQGTSLKRLPVSRQGQPSGRSVRGTQPPDTAGQAPQASASSLLPRRRNRRPTA